MSDAALAITAINAALLLIALVALALIFWRRDRRATTAAAPTTGPNPVHDPTTPAGLPVVAAAPPAGTQTIATAQVVNTAPPAATGPTAPATATGPTAPPTATGPTAPWTSPLAYRDPAVETTVDISRLGIEASVDLSARVLAELGYRYDPRNRTLEFLAPDLSTVTIQARTPSTLTLIGHGHVIPYLAYRLVDASTDIDPVVAAMPTRGSNGH